MQTIAAPASIWMSPVALPTTTWVLTGTNLKLELLNARCALPKETLSNAGTRTTVRSLLPLRLSTESRRSSTKRDDIFSGLRITNQRKTAVIAFSVSEEQKRVTVLGVFYGGQNYEELLSADS